MAKKSKKQEKPQEQHEARGKELIGSALGHSKNTQSEKRRRITKKPRVPNPRGAVLTLISLCLLYLAISANINNPSVLGVSDNREFEKQQAERAKAEENIKNDLGETATGIRGNFTSDNPVDAAVASVDKVNHDIEAAKKLPAQTVEAVKNMKVGDAFAIIMESVKRLSKIYSDAKGVHKETLKQVEKLQ